MLIAGRAWLTSTLCDVMNCVRDRGTKGHDILLYRVGNCVRDRNERPRHLLVEGRELWELGTEERKAMARPPLVEG